MGKMIYLPFYFKCYIVLFCFMFLYFKDKKYITITNCSHLHLFTETLNISQTTKSIWYINYFVRSNAKARRYGPVL